MINKRLLVKNLLAHNDENSFYDKKRGIDIGQKAGKAKFLKHVCALANSNPRNNSYIVIGVEDEDNRILGVDFFDDSKIQNLINAYLLNPPRISYENILFPHLTEGKVVGLVTIRSSGEICSLKRSIWKYSKGTVFFREGSISMPKEDRTTLRDTNAKTVLTIEKHARNNIELTLDAVLDFMNHRHKNLKSYYKVFKEQFVLCWAAHEKKTVKGTFYSRVDIELINEQVKLFYSALDEVAITYDENVFSIVEYIKLGLGEEKKYYPLEKVVIEFSNNGTYQIQSDLVFNPPQFNKKTLFHIFNSNRALLKKLSNKSQLSNRELLDLENLPATYLLCHLNGFEEARSDMEKARVLLKKQHQDVYLSLKESFRVLRKVKYN